MANGMPIQAKLYSSSSFNVQLQYSVSARFFEILRHTTYEQTDGSDVCRMHLCLKETA